MMRDTLTAEMIATSISAADRGSLQTWVAVPPKPERDFPGASYAAKWSYQWQTPNAMYPMGSIYLSPADLKRAIVAFGRDVPAAAAALDAEIKEGRYTPRRGAELDAAVAAVMSRGSA